MVKFITKISMAFMMMLCTGSFNAQNIIVGDRLVTPQRGPNSDIYYATGIPPYPFWKATLQELPGSAIGNAGKFMQGLEYINGTLYAVGMDYFGTVSMTNGLVTVIKEGFAVDAVSLCHNYVSGLTYVFPWQGGDFGTVDLATGEFTNVGTIPAGEGNTILAAIDNDGICYAIKNYSNEFGTVDLETGDFTLIANLSVSATALQNLSIDRETNELYWLSFNSTPTITLYRINKTSGELTTISTMPVTTASHPAFTIASDLPSPSLCDPTTNFTVNYTADCKAELTWEASGEDIAYNVYRDGTPVAENIAENFYTDEDFDAFSAHTWEVIVVCEEEESDPVTAPLDACEDVPPPPCNSVTDGAATVGCNTAVITWTAVEGAVEYEVYKDDVLLGKATNPAYTEEGTFEHGKTYTWSVVTICAENKSETVEISAVADCMGIGELANNLAIFPNPASKIVTIDAKDFVKVEIYNTVGQLMETKTVNTVDVSFYNAGIYFFKVYDVHNNAVTKRIMVAR